MIRASLEGVTMQDLRQDLTVRIRSGDKEAVEQAYDAYFTPVINFAYYMLYDYDTATDVSQEAFLRTVEACRDKKKDVRDFKSYLFGTARNLTMDQIGHAKRFAEVSDETLAFGDPNIFSDPARAALLGEQRASVAEATMKLNEHQRVALTLRDIEGWSYDDIGDFMGMSRNAVGVLLSRARLKFKREYRLQEIDAGRIQPECRDMLALMSAVLDGEATDPEKQMVQAHLAACPACRETMDELAGASTTLRSMAPVSPAFALKSALIAKATAVGFAAGATALTVGVGMSAATKAIIGIAASILVAGVGVGTYVGVKKVTAPGPTASIVKPADGVTLTVDRQPDGTGKVPMKLAVDNKPTAVEVLIDGMTMKHFDSGPYDYEWVTDKEGPHMVRPVAFDSRGKAHTGQAVTFTLVINKKMAEKIAYLRGGNIFSTDVDGTDDRQITSTGTARDFSTSPASEQIAFIDTSGVMHLVNANGAGLRQVTLPERGRVECAAFSYDGKYIYFARDVKEAGDTDYQNHVRFDRYDIAANSVAAVYEIPEPLQDESIGGVFTDPSGDYLYYNHFGSDFPSSEVYRISLKGTVTDAPFLAPRTDVPDTEVVKFMLQSVSADGTHIAYQKQAVMDREPPPGSQLGTSIEVSECIRPTEGGDEREFDTVDLARGSDRAIDELEFSDVDADRYFFTRKSQPDPTRAAFDFVMYTSTLRGVPQPTGLTATGWDEWHVLAMPQ